MTISDMADIIYNGAAGVRGTNEKRKYLLFDIDDARLPETASEYNVYITYYDTGVTAGGINTKNIQYYDLASGTSKAAGIFPTLDAKSETETTAAGWKTGYLKLNTNFADMTYTVDAAGDMRPGYSKDITQATDNLFTVSEITIVPFSDENAERAVKTRSFYLAGDSICEPLTAAYYPREGWGMEISDYFDDNMLVVNLAKGGKSSHTFLNGYDSTGQIVENDCRMDVIDALACKGDYLFISFGHNDRITETSTATKRATSPTADAPVVPGCAGGMRDDMR